jgi:glycosyltransferase involved in cell wall biosynthesis
MSRIAFLVDRPTQFDAPFFRFVAKTSEGSLRVLFSESRAGEAVADPELGRTVDWGFSLFEGYEHSIRSADTPVGEWLDRELGPRPPDLLVINGYTRPDYRHGLSWARRRTVPAALRIDSTTVDRSPLRRAIKRLIFATYLKPRFRTFLATSSRTERYLAAFGVPANRIGRFPYAIDEARFRTLAEVERPRRAEARAALGIPADVRVVLAVSKLGEREAPWDLVRLPGTPETDQLWIVVAGDGPDRPDFEAAAQARFGDRYRGLGYVPYPRLPSLYTMSDVFLHAPREERWGVSVAEALACGLPVVAADTVGAGHDLIERGMNGMIFPFGNPAALASALDGALKIEPATVQAESRERLAAWGYEASWRHLLEAARS